MAATTITVSEDALAISSTCDRAINSPAAAWQYFRDGVEQMNLGEPETALVAFQRALELSPNMPDTHVGIGVAYALCSEIYPAIDHLERAIQLEPSSFHAHFKLSQLYFKLRVPQKGYDESKLALRCAATMPERQLIAQILKEERAREHNGITRPWLNRTFSKPAIVVGLMVTVLALGSLILYVR